MKEQKSLGVVLAVAAAFLLSLPIVAQDISPASDKPIAEKSVAEKGQVSAGQKQKITGLLVRHENDNLTVRTQQGTEYSVVLNNFTKIREKKSNPFRSAKKYSVADLSRGLTLEIEGKGDGTGALVADQIKFSDVEMRMANSMVSLVTPVEGRVSDAEGRLAESEQNAKRLSGQLDELNAVANMANGGAKAAQETADKAMSAANSANERITTTAETLNSRISSLDDFDVAKTISINFKVGSAVLSSDAKTLLDEIAMQAKEEKGYVIQVAGFASADGNEVANRRLSQRRAEAVMSYLIENHDISQRRVVPPLGFGEARPASDNNTREGRKENRRVEVAILVNKGLAPAAMTTSSLNQTQQ